MPTFYHHNYFIGINCLCKICNQILAIFLMLMFQLLAIPKLYLKWVLWWWKEFNKAIPLFISLIMILFGMVMILTFLYMDIGRIPKLVAYMSRDLKLDSERFQLFLFLRNFFMEHWNLSIIILIKYSKSAYNFNIFFNINIISDFLPCSLVI